LEEKGQIKKVVGHSKLNIYSMFSLAFNISYRLKMEGCMEWKYGTGANESIARAVAAAE
jgi:hypothetical protein